MADNLSGGTTASFNNTPQAKDDYFSYGEDVGIKYLDVMGNDLGGNAKSLWSIDDATDAAPLYDKLERIVLPLYYNDRTRWVWMMKQAISKIGGYFNSQRMMRRYASDAYLR